MGLPKRKIKLSQVEVVADPPTPQMVEDGWPIKDKDYHIIRVGAVKPVPSGWLYSYTTRSNFTRSRISYYLSQHMAGALPGREGITSGIFIQWYLYPGPKPARKWGEVCP